MRYTVVRGMIVSKVSTAGIIAALFLLVGGVTAGSAQQPAPAAPAQPEIFLKQFIGDSAPPRPADSITRDDLRNVPPPANDFLPRGVRVNVVVGDPRCEPGEDWFDDGPRPRLPASRRR